MNALSRLFRRVRFLVRPGTLERDLQDEFDFHLAMREPNYRTTGMSSDEVHRTVRRQFGNIDSLKQSCREVWSFEWLETVGQDLRFGGRIIARSYVLTTVAVLTLSLGIGANTAIFSVVNAVLLKPLPYPAADDLVMVRQRVHSPGNDRVQDMITAADFNDWTVRSSCFSNLAAVAYHSFDLTGTGEPIRVEGDAVSASLFSVLQIRPLLGRVFQEEEDRYGANKVVVLSYSLWTNRFAADPKIIGRRVWLDGESYVVLGVMPKIFHFPDPDDQLWVPLALSPQAMINRSQHSFLIYARLKPGLGIAPAVAQMHTISQEIAQQFPDTNAGVSADLLSLREHVIGNTRPALLLLWCCTGLVLLIVCANVANLLLTRASVRRREFAVRAALGAAGSRIVRQLLTESLLLALIGGAAGLAVGVWAMHALKWITPPLSFPYLPQVEDLSLDGRLLAFTAGLSVLAGIIFGLAPAIQTARQNLHEVLQEEARGNSRARKPWSRALLVITETALGTMVVISAALLLRGFAQLAKVPLGFNPNNVLTLRVIPRGPRYSNLAERFAFYHEALNKIERIPGVRSAAAVSVMPLTRVRQVSGFSLEGRVPATSDQEPAADYRVITPEYFAVMGIPFVRGRPFSWSDVQATLPVAIISKNLADTFWPNADPIGMHIKPGPPASTSPWLTVIGVVADVRNFDVPSPPQSTIYLPYAQSRDTAVTLLDLVVRTSQTPWSVATPARTLIASIDPGLSISRMRSMEEVFAISIAPFRFNLVLLSLLALLAVVLAAIGLYGVTAFSVEGRRSEIGIRMALGADATHVVKLIVVQGARLALGGIGLGIIGSLCLGGLMRSLVFEIGTVDLPTYAAAGLFLGAIALVACYLPARSAARIDPIVALRHE